MTSQRNANDIDPKMLNALEWRCIGPPRGGRVVAVAGDPVDLGTFYFGACAGGVWKTYDGGAYWENVSDGYFSTASVGAIAVSDSDPSVIYAGMGETQIRPGRNPRRRRLQVERRRPFMGPPGTRGHTAHLAGQDSPDQPGHSVRRRARPRLRTKRTAGRVQVERRRQELGQRSVRQRKRGHSRPLPRP